MGENKEIQEGKIFAVLAYLSVLCLVPLLLQKENKFALHHAKQGLVIFMGEVAIWVVGWIPFLGWAIALIGLPLLFILSLIGIIQVLMGKYWRCPVVAEIADKIKI